MLILCPECGKQVSDKANMCVNCGCPIEHAQFTNDSGKLYKVRFKKFISTSAYKKRRTKVYVIIQNVYGGFKQPISHQSQAVNLNEPTLLFDGITKQTLDVVEKYLHSCGCITEVMESDLKKPSELNDKVYECFADEMILKCPRCGSTAITTGQRGYSLFTGFLGSSKTVNRCGKCGYSWEP